MADFHKVGGITPKAVIYKSESHKLHQAFNVKSGDTVVAGQPVVLNDDGTISPYKGTGIYLGVAVNYSKYPVYPPEDVNKPQVTVMMEGFAVIHGIVKTTNVTKCGFVNPDGTLDESGIYPNYIPVAEDYLNAKGTVADTTFTGQPIPEVHFIAITKGNIGDIIRILVR